MTERKTSSILQRMPLILAVTAASYGLQFPPQASRPGAPSATASNSRLAPGQSQANLATHVARSDLKSSLANAS